VGWVESDGGPVVVKQKREGLGKRVCVSLRRRLGMFAPRPLLPRSVESRVCGLRRQGVQASRRQGGHAWIDSLPGPSAPNPRLVSRFPRLPRTKCPRVKRLQQLKSSDCRSIKGMLAIFKPLTAPGLRCHDDV
jgi:hypothetical protein